MYIVNAAIRELNGTIHIGKRHSDIIMSAIRKGMVDDFEEGFMTNTGIFVNRSEAAKIAFDSGQIKEAMAKLHSENLW